MRKKKIEVKIDPEELALESKVKDIMGPAQHLDGSKPSEEEITEMADAGMITEKADGPVRSINQRPAGKPVVISVEHAEDSSNSAPPSEQQLDKTEIERMNEKLNEQIEDGLAEIDLADMGESDVTTTQKLYAQNRADDLKSAGRHQPKLTRAPAIETSEEMVTSAPVSTAEPKKPKSRRRFSRLVRYGVPLLVVATAAALMVIPVARAQVLSAFGVRSGVLVKTIDDTTTLPLENVVVSVDGKQVKTDENGVARINGVRLGAQTVTLTKSAFYSQEKKIDVGIRVADLGDISLKPSGERYTYVLKDYVSGQSVPAATLKSGEVTALSNKDGRAVIALKQNSEDPRTLSVSAKGYRTETVTPPLEPKGLIELRLVPDKKHAYVSKQANRYDVYTVDVDGKNSKLLLEGTGLETSAIAGSMSPSNRYFALVSTRDDKRNASGTLLIALTVLDITSEEATVIEHAEQIALLGWSGDTLFYMVTSTSAPAITPDRQKIQSYNVANTKRVSLGKASSYLAVSKTPNAILAVESSATDVQKDILQTISYSGEKKEIYSGDILAIGRIDYASYSVQTSQKLFEYTLGNTALADGSQAGTALNRYIDSPNGKTSVWLPTTSAQPQLVTYSVDDSKEQSVSLAVAPKNILWWVGNDGVVVQVNSNGQTADYIVNVRNGKAQKITDSTAITSVN